MRSIETLRSDNRTLRLELKPMNSDHFADSVEAIEGEQGNLVVN
jgi:hypothetical protein